jgi:hypothetical protein
MALVLKQGKTFNPAISAKYGVDMTSNSYYGVIDRVEFDKKDKTCDFAVDIYGNEEQRNSDTSTIVDRFVITIHSGEYDEKIGNTGITIAQAYIIAAGKYTDWETDEV